MKGIYCKRRLKLAIAIIRDGRKKYEIAKACDMTASRLSQILAGAIDPTEKQAGALAKALGSHKKGLGL